LAFGNSLTLLYLSRILTGAGSAAGFLVSSKVATLVFPVSRVPFMLGCTLAMGTAGALFGGAPLVWLSTLYGWRTVVGSLAVIGVLLGSVTFFILRVDGSGKGASSVASYWSKTLWVNCLSALAI
jgi:predicted MFS family arabinose efflux permease